MLLKENGLTVAIRTTVLVQCRIVIKNSWAPAAKVQYSRSANSPVFGLFDFGQVITTQWPATEAQQGTFFRDTTEVYGLHPLACRSKIVRGDTAFSDELCLYREYIFCHTGWRKVFSCRIFFLRPLCSWRTRPNLVH